MATQDYWADARFDRGSRLFSVYFPTLDSLISLDDPVRLVDEVLEEVDWSSWEEKYRRRMALSDLKSLVGQGLRRWRVGNEGGICTRPVEA